MHISHFIYYLTSLSSLSQLDSTKTGCLNKDYFIYIYAFHSFPILLTAIIRLLYVGGSFSLYAPSTDFSDLRSVL